MDNIILLLNVKPQCPYQHLINLVTCYCSTNSFLPSTIGV